MKRLPTIYKLTKTGQIQEWTITVDGDSFYSSEGIVGGKITTNLPTKCLPKNGGKKNETSGEEQAVKEAEAKWKKKIEKGYFESIEEAQGGESKFYEPMLAQKFEDYSDGISFPLYCQPKLDGIRCIMTKDGMFSRNGKKIVSAPHLRKNLDGFFKKNANAVLDGELYCDKLKDDFNKICSLVKKTKPTAEDLRESESIIEYWVYDAPVIGTYSEEDLFSERLELLSSLVGKKYDKIVLVKTDLAKNKYGLDYFYEENLEAGFEGQMVRSNSPYENKRTKSLLKRKEFIDEEYKILKVVEGEGNRVGTVGHMEFRSKTGKLFKSNVKGDFGYLSQLFSNKEKLVGKDATIKYFNLTPDGVPRFGFVISIRDYE